MKQYTNIIAMTILAIALVSVGCKGKPVINKDSHDAEATGHEGHGHEDASNGATVWQDSLEIFAEWAELVGGKEGEMLVHVTDLENFKAVTEGALTLTFIHDERETYRVTANKPVRPGIFDVHLTAPAGGEYELAFALNRSGRIQRAVFEDVDVHGTAGEGHEDEHAGHDHAEGEGHEDEHAGHDHAEGEGHGDEHAGHNHAEGEGHGDEHAVESTVEPVKFLKEQQWQFEFATQVISRRTLSDNIRALGEIKAAGIGEAEVFAPFDGVLMPDPQHGIVRPGQKVTKGEILARIAPSGGPESSWTQMLNDYKLSKSESDRVNRLADEGAVSTKRRDEARLDLENKRSRVRGVLGGADTDIDALLAEGEHFHLRAPASGVITDIHLRSGQHVETGEHLFNIIDPSKVWLEVQVPVSESSKLDEVTDANFTLSGSEEIYRVSELGGRLVTVSTLLDPLTRRIPVIFELQNANSKFRPGSFAQVYLKTSSSVQALAVPESSLLDEDGSPVVYVQIGGEEFVRRVVKTGVKDEGFVEIISGLRDGERVVTTGAFKVRLASLKISAEDAGHAGHNH